LITVLFVFRPNPVSAFAKQGETEFARFLLAPFVESISLTHCLRIMAENRRLLGDLVAKKFFGIVASFQDKHLAGFTFIAERIPAQLKVTPQDEFNIAATWPLARTVHL
jgi:hypothetical protein